MNFQSGTYFRETKGGQLSRPIGVVVEGKDDAHFVDHLLGSLGADPDRVQVVFSGGIDEMERQVPLIVKSRPYVTRQLQRIAIIRDSDVDAAASEAQLRLSITTAGLPDVAHGQIETYDNGRQIGIFLIPTNTQAGAIEDLLLDTVASGEKFQLLNCAYGGVEALEGEFDRRAKRLMQMYLSVCPELCKGGGIGLKFGNFPDDHASLNPIRSFLADLIAE